MKKMRKFAGLLLVPVMLMTALTVPAMAKTTANGQQVQNIFFYVVDDSGKEILASVFSVEELYQDLESGKINNTVYNYSVLDRYVTPVHQETQGMTVEEFVRYAQQKSTSPAIRNANLTFLGRDEIAFWELDGSDYDDMDTYTYDELYSTTRYNFPALYEYWDFTTQSITDVNAVWVSREEALPRLSVTAYSGRYMSTGIYLNGDYNMENYWSDQDLLDMERTMRVLMPMTEADLRQQNSTASDTRYWVCYIRLDDAASTGLSSQGMVAAPTYMVVDGDESKNDNYDSGYWYYFFDCATDGASIYYNQNFLSMNYMPTAQYTGSAVQVPKDAGSVNVRAVKVGYADAGVVNAKPDSAHIIPASQAPESPSGNKTWENPYTDVSANDWYADAVEYAVNAELFFGTSDTMFSPDGDMNRAMFTTVLHRLAGTPDAAAPAQFTDVPAGQWYSEAVAWASEQGYVNGVGEGAFAPEGTITLEQMLTILYRYSGSPTVVGNGGTAYGPVSDWAESGMTWAVNNGLLNGVGGTLTAQSSATRAQVAAILMNLAG